MSKKVNSDAKNLIDLPVYLFHQGTNYNAYEFFGAHFTNLNGKKGVVFRTYAPNADSVAVVGEFNNWSAENYYMNRISKNGVYELFIENVKQYDLYKFLVTRKGKSVLKADPYAFHSETPPKTASKVYDLEGYIWQDGDYIKNKTTVYDKPVNVYEVNLLSWKRHSNGDYYSYRQLAEELVPYVKEMGYTHVEFMPLAEHPYDGSWGYQVTGYYSITSRLGTPKDFMYLIDVFHQNGIGVILDWVPAHFPKDEHGLYEFDGTCCYEYKEWHKKEHKSWGTRVFNLGKNEVKSFLISNAMFLLKEFHLDGLRVDAVASMLYLDYDKKPGEWLPNKYGEKFNLEAIDFFKQLNTAVFASFPNVLMIAEESTAYAKITKPVYDGGLGFNFKWNMGWMNDVLSYMETDPYFRSGIHDKITFSLCYAFSENYVLPISHDEVVHGKKSLLDKMCGDTFNKFSQIRAFNAYMFAHPGKKLNFMGNEYGQFKEWDYKEGLEFFMLKYPLHKKLLEFNKELNKIYKENKPLYEIEDSWDGFNWISVDEKDNNIIAFTRTDKGGNKIYVLINFSGNEYINYRLGVGKGKYKAILNTDDVKFGGYGLNKTKVYKTVKKPAHNSQNSISINVPKFSAFYFIKTN